MKKLNVLFIACIICIGVIHFNSCTKKADDQTKTELLTGVWWKMTAQTVSPATDMNGDGTLETDLFTSRAACEKDDLIKFNTNGTITNDQKTLCTGQTAKTDGGTWKWNSDETELTLGPPTGSTDPAWTFKVTELTTTTLKGTETFTNAGSAPSTITTTLAAQ
jgi:hypothetical protein